MAKKLTFSQQKVNFLAITFQSVNRLISNFEYGKIWRIHGLFAKAVCWNKVVILGEKWLTWAIIYCISSRWKQIHLGEIISPWWICGELILLQKWYTLIKNLFSLKGEAQISWGLILGKSKNVEAKCKGKVVWDAGYLRYSHVQWFEIKFQWFEI